MARSVNTAAFLERWLATNSARLHNRFQVVRANDWSLWNEQGIALFLEGELAVGSFLCWAKHLADAEWPFADAEVLDVRTDEQVFVQTFQPLSTELLDSWLSTLETLNSAD